MPGPNVFCGVMDMTVQWRVRTLGTCRLVCLHALADRQSWKYAFRIFLELFCMTGQRKRQLSESSVLLSSYSCIS